MGGGGRGGVHLDKHGPLRQPDVDLPRQQQKGGVAGSRGGRAAARRIRVSWARVSWAGTSIPALRCAPGFRRLDAPLGFRIPARHFAHGAWEIRSAGGDTAGSRQTRTAGRGASRRPAKDAPLFLFLNTTTLHSMAKYRTDVIYRSIIYRRPAKDAPPHTSQGQPWRPRRRAQAHKHTLIYTRARARARKHTQAHTRARARAHTHAHTHT